MKMNSSRFSSLIIYADGSWTPMGAGAGIIIMDSVGRLLHIENRLITVNDNNEAEYAALLLGLQTAIRLDADVVELRMDSEVIVKQMLGDYAVRSTALKEWHWQACHLAMELTRVRYHRIPRNHNALADALAGEASAGRHWKIGVA